MAWLHTTGSATSSRSAHTTEGGGKKKQSPLPLEEADTTRPNLGDNPETRASKQTQIAREALLPGCNKNNDDWKPTSTGPHQMTRAKTDDTKSRHGGTDRRKRSRLTLPHHH